MSKTFYKVGIIAALVALMGGTLTFLMTWKNIGFASGFITAWLSSFALCLLCIAPIGGIIAFLVNRTITKLLANVSSQIKKDVIFGLTMAIIMESIMAIITTYNLHGFVIMEKFIAQWGTTFITALPLGIVLSIILSLLIKPKLVKFWATA